MKYFSEVKTSEDAKKRYHELAILHHPDKGGDVAIMQEINNEFEQVWERVKNIRTNSSNETYESDKEQEIAQDIINRLGAIIGLEGVTIEIIGTWIWVSGNTYPNREVLKFSGYTYSKTKKAWYHTGEIEKSAFKRRGNFKLEELREKWGTQEIPTQVRATLA